MSLCEFLTDKQIASLYEHLAAGGFQPPVREWLEVRLQEIHFDLERIRWQRDGGSVAEAADTWQEAGSALGLTLRLVRHWHDDLTAERLSPDVDMTAGDAWHYNKAEPIKESDLARYMVPAEFSEDEIGTCLRVLAAVRKRTEQTRDYHRQTFATRPERKEKPEMWAVIGGLSRIWCQAMRIEESDLVLSLSDGNAAVNFVEEGTGMLLHQAMERETIFKRLLEHRARARA